MLTTLTDSLPQIVLLSILAVGLVRGREPWFHHYHLDQVSAVLGLLLGLLISLLNFIYSNHYLKTLGPILAITCAVYLIIRKRILEGDVDRILPRL